MSESMQASVGTLLREAREAQGMTLDNAAERLRLMHRQIEAMEQDDFESLGQPVFARGFVRNYARLLGLAPETLLSRMEGAPAEPTQVSQAEPPTQRSWLTSPWLIVLMLGFLVVVAAPVALYLWLNSEVDEHVDKPSPVAKSQSAPRPVPAAPVPAAALAVPGEVAEPVADAAQSAESAATATAEPPKAASVVHLEFRDEAWVEIKDASGRMLARQLSPAGSGLDLQGQPPFEAVIGNAAQVHMTYNGRPIDLKPFIDVSVARFTLEE